MVNCNGNRIQVTNITAFVKDLMLIISVIGEVFLY